MKQIVALIVAILFFAVASITLAASPQDVQKFTKTIYSNRSKLLKFHRLENGVYEAVYVINKKRCTVTIAGKHLFFYIRTNGTFDDRRIEMVGGNNGKVNWGAKGTSHKMNFTNFPGVQEGLQHQQYWQAVYDEAIISTINHFK